MQSSFPTAAGEMGQVSSCRLLRICLYLALMLIPLVGFPHLAQECFVLFYLNPL